MAEWEREDAEQIAAWLRSVNARPHP